MNCMSKHNKLGEDGFAPIIVSIIIVIVLSLLTLSFVALANNSAKNALNRQLSNNAYYAADSGINDAIAAIGSGFHSAKTSCNPILSVPDLSNNQVNGPQDIYSCLLIDPTPSSLQYTTVTETQPTVALISTINPITNNPEAPAYFIFSWEPSPQVESPPYVFAPTNYFPNCSAASGIKGACLYPGSSWNISSRPITGILRTALTPIVSSGQLPTNTSTTYTAFLYPQLGNGALSSINTAPPYSPNTTGINGGVSVSGNCSSASTQPYECAVEIPISNAATNGFILSMESLYTDSRVKIEAFDSLNNRLMFKNAQIMIDSTGNDHGVQRRIQVRISSINYTGFSAYDIASSSSFCKDLYAYPMNLATGNPGGAVSPNCGL